eukprot:146496-Amphidinium_carterae.1
MPMRMSTLQRTCRYNRHEAFGIVPGSSTCNTVTGAEHVSGARLTMILLTAKSGLGAVGEGRPSAPCCQTACAIQTTNMNWVNATH